MEATMKSSKIAALLALSLLAGARPVGPAEAQQQAQAAQGSGDSGDIEVKGKWRGPKWPGAGPMPRHYIVTLWGVPAPYDGMTNPLPQRKGIYDRGERIYKNYCAMCHGDDGAGDGTAGRTLNPPPGNLIWLSDVPEKKWDEFMVWTIAEGGTALGTSMPAYKQLLTQEEIWAVTAYIQKNIPFVSRMR
jgi:mono/diheme cytochrome c family protein